MASLKLQRVLQGVVAGLILWVIYRFAAPWTPRSTEKILTKQSRTEVNPTQRVNTTPTAEVTTSPGTRHQQVLLVTRGRSGSSFTSELVRINPDVFFFFEPLQRVEFMYREREKRKPYDFDIWGDNRKAESLKLTESFLTCDLKNASVLNNTLFRIRNNTMVMSRCVNDIHLSGWEHLACYLDMVKNCTDRKIVFAKTVRFRLGWAEKLLQKLPTFKVIFLIRDPRAVLHSQSRVWTDWFNWKTDLDAVSAKYCRTLSDDVSHFQRLKNLYPSRLKLIRYEDGAARPHEFTQDIYRFLNLEYSDRIRDYVTGMTSKGVYKHLMPGYKSKSYDLHRDDPVMTSQKWRWRGSSNFETISLIDGHCADVYPLLGYRKVTSRKDLKSNKTLVHKHVLV